MHKNEFSIHIIVGGNEYPITAEAVCWLNDGDEYVLRMHNRGQTLCDAEVSMDGNITPVGKYRISAGHVIDVERPAAHARKFTFVRDTSEEAKAAGGIAGQNTNGLVTVIFLPELRESSRHMEQSIPPKMLESSRPTTVQEVQTKPPVDHKVDDLQLQEIQRKLDEVRATMYARLASAHVSAVSEERPSWTSRLCAALSCQSKSSFHASDTSDDLDTVLRRGEMLETFIDKSQTLDSSSVRFERQKTSVDPVEIDRKFQMEETQTSSGLTVLRAASLQTFTSVPALGHDAIDRERITRMTVRLSIRDGFGPSVATTDDSIAVSSMTREPLQSISAQGFYPDNIE